MSTDRECAIPPKWKTLSRDDLAGLFGMLEAGSKARGVSDLQRTTLAVLRDEWGYESSTFFLAGRPDTMPLVHTPQISGFNARSLETYLTRFREQDVFAGPMALARFRTAGIVTFEEIESSLDCDGRRYVREFMEPLGIRAQVSIWLDTSLPVHGILSVMSRSKDAFGSRDRTVLLAFRTILSNLLRSQLLTEPRNERLRKLSRRERDIARLIASGFDNAAIAQALAINVDTVKKHLSSAYAKVNVSGRVQLALLWRSPENA